jgi:hypothetical protein
MSEKHFVHDLLARWMPYNILVQHSVRVPEQIKTEKGNGRTKAVRAWANTPYLRNQGTSQ